MTYFLGDQNKLVGFYESGTWASKSGNAFWLGQVQEFTPADTRTIISPRYMGTDDRNIQQHIEVARDYGGTFRYYPQDWKMVYFVLGSVYSAAGYVHKITESNSDDISPYTKDYLDSFSLENAEISNAAGSGTNLIKTTYGCKVDQLTIRGRQGEPVECEVVYIGKSGLTSSGAETAVTAATTTPYIFEDAAMQIPSGTSINEVTDFSLVVNNNLERKRYANATLTVDALLPITRDYTWVVTADKSSSNIGSLYREYFVAGSEFNGIFSISKTATGSIYIALSGCTITDMDDPTAKEGVNAMTMTIKPKSAYAQVGDATALYGAW